MDVFKLMKPSAFIINTARGGIVNEVELNLALKEGLIAGAALDVYETEPPIDIELLKLPNLICTPHTGGNSYEAVVAMGLSAIEHLLSYRNKLANNE
jgi:D-3-phosphoglycerate dehydrogenase